VAAKRRRRHKKGKAGRNSVLSLLRLFVAKQAEEMRERLAAKRTGTKRRDPRFLRLVAAHVSLFNTETRKG
jgi:hypothetical protein